MSGLNQRFTKPSSLNRLREFESHRLRNGLEEQSKRLFEPEPLRMRGEIRMAQAEKIILIFKLPSRGREYLDFYEQSEIKSLVTRDRISPPPQNRIFFVLYDYGNPRIKTK